MSRVSVADAEARLGKVYAMGCTGLVAELLGRPYKNSHSYVQGASIGKNGVYHGGAAGGLVGLPGPRAGAGGEPGPVVVGRGGPAKACRRLERGYGDTEVFLYSY